MHKGIWSDLSTCRIEKVTVGACQGTLLIYRIYRIVMLYTSQVDCMNRCMYILGLHTWISAERQREGFLGIIFSPERGGKKHPSTEFTGNKKKRKRKERKENSPTSHLTKPQAEQKLRRTLHPFPRKAVKKDFSLLSYHLMFLSSVSPIRETKEHDAPSCESVLPLYGQ